MTFFDFRAKGLLIDVPTTPTTALALGNGSLPFSDPLLFVIPSVPGFPASPLSPATTYVVLSKENHMQLTEAATLDRKSGEAEGSAVRHSCAPPLPAHNLSFRILPAPACRGSEALRRSIANRGLYSAESREPRRCLLADDSWELSGRKLHRKTKKSPTPTGANPDFLPRSARHGHFQRATPAP